MTSRPIKQRLGITCLYAVLASGLACAALSCGRRTEDTGVYAVGKDVKAPEIVAQPLPAYTEEARQARVEGVVLLQCIVRKNGSVDSFRVLRDLGYGLDESAINTIAAKWRFKPGTRNGVPVDVQANIEVTFKFY